MNILIVEDEVSLSNAIKKILEQHGYLADAVYDGFSALDYAKGFSYDLIILDVMLPKLDGFEVVRLLRKDGLQTPVLMLTARTATPDKVTGLNSGADDYMTKPFNPLELTARVRSQLRRYNQLGSAASAASSKMIRCGGLEIDDEAKTVSVDGDKVSLTPLEYGILKLLASNAGRVFSIDEIYEKVWKEEAYGAENTVAVHIRRIREKIEIDPKNPRYLKVVWGVGYKVEKQ